MSSLVQIQEEVRQRVGQIVASQNTWPCRKGCDDCCRNLAAEPRVTRQEWDLMAAAINHLPIDQAENLRQRIRDAAGASRPVICPLLDRGSGVCMVYEARPVACRAYGFYAERGEVLGCGRIESEALRSRDIVWGNHAALEQKLGELGRVAEFSVWIGSPG